MNIECEVKECVFELYGNCTKKSITIKVALEAGGYCDDYR